MSKDGVDNMKKYIDEYLKIHLTQGHISKLQIPKYLENFFIYIEFNKYLIQYLERFSRISYILSHSFTNASASITASNTINDELRNLNDTCYNHANELKNKVSKFSNPDEKKTWRKDFFGYGTSGTYAKMVESAKKEEPPVSGDVLKNQIVFMISFCEMIYNFEKMLKETVEYTENFSTKLFELFTKKNSINGVIGYKKLNELLYSVKNSASDPLLQQILQNLQDGKQKTDEINLPLLQEENTTVVEACSGGSRRQTHRRRHYHSMRSRKLIKRSKKGKKIMKQYTKNRRVNIRKQNKRKNKSRKYI
jgi:hypothetical protein